jgi:hypothetical protein
MGAHKTAGAASSDYQPLGNQLAERFVDRISRHAQIARQRPTGWQTSLLRQSTAGNRSADPLAYAHMGRSSGHVRVDDVDRKQ